MQPETQELVGTEMSPPEHVINQDTVPDFRFIPVTLTFDGYPPFKFKFRRQQSKEVKEAKQAYYALPEDKQQETLRAHRVLILSQLLEEPPTGIPDFYKDEDDENFRSSFVTYFSDEANEDTLQWLWSIYQGKLYPKELLSSALE